jgi:tRNA(Ile)-lysidine synthase
MPGGAEQVRLPVADPVRRAVSDWLTEFAGAGPLVVAVSGGADSLALAAAVAAETAGDGRRAVAVTVDHGLQPGSALQADRCAEQLRRIGFSDVRIAAVTVGRTGGTEAAARTARYRALLQLAADLGSDGPAPVLLGHTLDDQAETVLLGLARGSGPRSVAGMRRWRPPWGRPLLAVRRGDTEKACAAVGLTPWSDPHNEDPAFTRVRLRTEVLPLLEQVLAGGVAAALARTADLLADDLQALDLIADLILPSVAAGPGLLEAATLAVEPPAVRRRIVRQWLAGQGISGLTADHLYRLDRLLDGRDGAAVRLPGGWDVTRSERYLRVHRVAD